MEQLVMRWKNDGTPAVPAVLPESVELKRFTEIDNALSEWIDVIRYMDGGEKIPDEEAYYRDVMLCEKGYDDNLCFILTVDGVCAASITVICDYEKKDGYIHMVACKPEFRGRGLGNLLNDVALWVLKTEGMQTAYLTTDDWRIPAINTYLNASFVPDTETCPDYKERWEKIFEKINSK